MSSCCCYYVWWYVVATVVVGSVVLDFDSDFVQGFQQEQQLSFQRRRHPPATRTTSLSRSFSSGKSSSRSGGLIQPRLSSSSSSSSSLRFNKNTRQPPPPLPQQHLSGRTFGSSTTQLSVVSPTAAAATAAAAAAVSTSSTTNAIVSLVSSPVGAVTVLAGIVLIHEAGHYLAARYYNISVDEFSIGFGPKLVGFEAYGNEFNVRLLPLGGYVKFPPNFNTTLVEEQQELARQAYKTRVSTENWTLSERILNIATLGIWDEQRRKKQKQQQQQLEAAATAADDESDNAVMSLLTNFANKIRGGKVKQQQKTDQSAAAGGKVTTDPEDYEIEYYDDPGLLQNRPWQERAVVLSGGVIFNFVLSFMLYFGAIFTPTHLSNQGLPRPVFSEGVVVSAPPVSSGPASTLLRQGDIITSVNGRKIQIPSSSSTTSTATTSSVLDAQKQVSDVISTIRETPDGGTVEFEIIRQQSQSQTPNSPTTLTKVTLKPQRAGAAAGATPNTNTAPSSPQTIGVLLAPKLLKVENLQSNNPIVAAKLAYEYLVSILRQTLDGIVSVLTTFVTSSKPPPGQSISGPIGLIKQGSNVVATRDLTAVLLFAAGLSVNLGVINALPLPALDGGQLVFVIAEALTGRKIDQRLQEGITSVAVLFLLWVSVSAAIGDVGNIISGLL